MHDGKPVIRYFVSYAHDDNDLKNKLLAPLKQQLAIAKDYCFEAWDDGEILAGEHWHEQIQAAVARCQFGLLLVSPAFLGSMYIKDHELPTFVASNLAAPEPEKRAIPVALKHIPFDSSIDLKGLEQLQVFHDSSRKTFQECSNSRTRDKFALELFQQILKIVKRYGPPPPISSQGHILWFNDSPKEIEPYKDVLIAEGYSVTNVTTVIDANSHLDHHYYDLLILDVMIPTWNDQEEEEYPPDITDKGRTLGLQFYRKNKNKLKNKGTQVLVITKLEDIRDKFIQAGLLEDQFCTAFSVRRVKMFMDKVNAMLSRAQWSREKAEGVLLQLSSNDEKEIHAACFTLTTLAALAEPLYSKVRDRLQELTQPDNPPRIKQQANDALAFVDQLKGHDHRFGHSNQHVSDRRMRDQQRLNRKRDDLQRQWELLSKKLSELNEQLILETRVEEKLRLRNLTDDTQIQRGQVEEQLKDIESQLDKVDSDAKSKR